MPLQRPRRIFRPSLLARPGPALLRATLVGAALATFGAALVLVAANMEFSGHAVPSPSRLSAEPSQVAVVDAGTLRINRQVVRLLGVDPPPRGERCGSADDCGTAAANALADLVRQKRVVCALQDQDPLGRPLAVCEAAGTQINRAVVASGWARAESGAADLRAIESAARAGRLGLWADPGAIAARAKVAPLSSTP